MDSNQNKNAVMLLSNKIYTSNIYSESKLSCKVQNRDTGKMLLKWAYQLSFYGSCLSVSSTTDSADSLFVHFYKTLKADDSVEPEKVKIISGRQKAPSRNKPAVTQVRKQSARKFSANGEKLICRFTTESSNRSFVFTVEELTNPPTRLAPDFLSLHKCNEFASFFSRKKGKYQSDNGTRPLLQMQRETQSGSIVNL